MYISNWRHILGFVSGIWPVVQVIPQYVFGTWQPKRLNTLPEVWSHFCRAAWSSKYQDTIDWLGVVDKVKLYSALFQDTHIGYWASPGHLTARSWPQGARTVRWASNTHAHTHTHTHTSDLTLEHNALLSPVLFFIDLSVGSGDGLTDGEDFNRTHQVDHLALLGTSSSVSAWFVTLPFL